MVDTEAASCPFCFNGKITDTACKCECQLGYLPPTCSFTALENVTVYFTLNLSASQFSASMFKDAVERVIGIDARTVFVSAADVARFQATSVLVEMPGYAVERVVASAVRHGDPWALEWGVMSVFPVTPDPPSKPLSLDYVLYGQGSDTQVTLLGIIWVGSAAGLVTVALCLDSTCTSNAEEEITPELLFETRQDQKKARQSRGSTGVRVARRHRNPQKDRRLRGRSMSSG